MNVVKFLQMALEITKPLQPENHHLTLLSNAKKERKRKEKSIKKRSIGKIKRPLRPQGVPNRRTPNSFKAGEEAQEPPPTPPLPTSHLRNHPTIFLPFGARSTSSGNGASARRRRLRRRWRHGRTWRGSGGSGTSSGAASRTRWRRTCTRR